MERTMGFEPTTFCLASRERAKGVTETLGLPGISLWIVYETSKCAIEEEVMLNIDLSPCNGYVTDFAKKRPITANGA